MVTTGTRKTCRKRLAHQLSTFCSLQMCIGHSERNSRFCLCGQNMNTRNKNQPKTFERGSATTKTTNKADTNMNIKNQIEMTPTVRSKLPGGPGNGTNPRRLFAAGWSAAFPSAMKQVASK